MFVLPAQGTITEAKDCPSELKEAPADSIGPGLHGKDVDPGDTPHRGPVPLVGPGVLGERITCRQGFDAGTPDRERFPDSCSALLALGTSRPI